MKLRILLIVAVALAFSACDTPYQATDTNTTTTSVAVPANIETTFSTQYPNATNITWSNYDATVAIPVDWELLDWSAMGPEDYLVRFDMNNDNYYAWYDSDGTWIGTAYAVRDYTSLPMEVNRTLNDKYPGYSITSVAREFQKDRMAYEIEMEMNNNKVKLLVDEKGNILKEKTKTK